MEIAGAHVCHGREKRSFKETMIVWPPSYQIKKHRLAKASKLRAMEDHCLQITVPMRFNLKKIPGILEENKSWIISHLEKIKVKNNDVLPDHILFQAMNETWRVHYVPCQSKFEMIVRPAQEIVFVGKQRESEFYRKKLITWIKNHAGKYLLAALQNISQQTQMEFEKLIIRDQKTVWGSCTVNKSISLNYKLVFLPQHLLQHVIIHELCHTIYLNHSDKFWMKVAEFDQTAFA